VAVCDYSFPTTTLPWITSVSWCVWFGDAVSSGHVWDYCRRLGGQKPQDERWMCTFVYFITHCWIAALLPFVILVLAECNAHMAGK